MSRLRDSLTSVERTPRDQPVRTMFETEPAAEDGSPPDASTG